MSAGAPERRAGILGGREVCARRGSVSAGRDHRLPGLFAHRIGFGVRVVDAIARGVPLKDAARILELIIAVAGVLARHLPLVIRARLVLVVGRLLDRKSTRLNSSHVSISYAVFCLKKKKKK